jgi:DNA-binding NtrC family response regulator
MTPGLAEQGARARVLVVDDEPALLQLTAAFLEDEFDVLTAQSSQQAIAILEQRPVNVVCTDFRMPDMDGLKLVRWIAQRHPNTSSILITGFSEYVQQERQPDDLFLLLVKPYEPAKLIESVRRAVQYSRMKRTIEKIAPLLRGKGNP